MKGTMTCKEFEKQIPNFVEKKLDYWALKRFKGHYDSCPECQEELAIQYLVFEGLNRLEKGEAFDLQNELNRRIQEAGRQVEKDDNLLNLGTMLETVAMAAVAILALWILLH